MNKDNLGKQQIELLNFIDDQADQWCEKESIVIKFHHLTIKGLLSRGMIEVVAEGFAISEEAHTQGWQGRVRRVPGLPEDNYDSPTTKTKLTDDETEFLVDLFAENMSDNNYQDVEGDSLTVKKSYVMSSNQNLSTN